MFVGGGMIDGVDLEIFNTSHVDLRVSKKISFIGNLLRFGKERSLDTVINAFSSPELEDYQLNIVGGPDSEAMKIRKLLSEKNIMAWDPNRARGGPASILFFFEGVAR